MKNQPIYPVYGVKVLCLKETKVDLTKLSSANYNVLTESASCDDCGYFGIEEEFKRSQQDKQGLPYVIEADVLRSAIETDVDEDYRWGFCINEEVNVANAKMCEFGVLRMSNGKKVMFSIGCLDVDAALAAYQALTYHGISSKHMHFFWDDERFYFKLVLGETLYEQVLTSLGIDE